MAIEYFIMVIKVTYITLFYLVPHFTIINTTH